MKWQKVLTKSKIDLCPPLFHPKVNQDTFQGICANFFFINIIWLDAQFRSWTDKQVDSQAICVFRSITLDTKSDLQTLYKGFNLSVLPISLRMSRQKEKESL